MKDFLDGTKRRPTPPGEVLMEVVTLFAGLTQAKLARALGVPRLTISEIALGKRRVTPDIAIRLAIYFGTGVDLWLGLQRDVDVWDAKQTNRKAYARIKPLAEKAAKKARVRPGWVEKSLSFAKNLTRGWGDIRHKRNAVER
jgi:antitoxin HigA-1